MASFMHAFGATCYVLVFAISIIMFVEVCLIIRAIFEDLSLMLGELDSTIISSKPVNQSTETIKDMVKRIVEIKIEISK